MRVCVVWECVRACVYFACCVCVRVCVLCCACCLEHSHLKFYRDKPECYNLGNGRARVCLGVCVGRGVGGDSVCA